MIRKGLSFAFFVLMASTVAVEFPGFSGDAAGGVNVSPPATQTGSTS